MTSPQNRLLSPVCLGGNLDLSTAFGLVLQSRSLEENVLKYIILTNWYTEKRQILIGSIPSSLLGNGAAWQEFPGQQMAIQLCAAEKRKSVTDRSQCLAFGHCWLQSSRACPWAKDYLTILNAIVYKCTYFIFFFIVKNYPCSNEQGNFLVSMLLKVL